MEVNLLEKMGACSLQAITIIHNPSRKYTENDSVHLMSYTASFPWSTGQQNYQGWPSAFWMVGYISVQHLAQLAVTGN